MREAFYTEVNTFQESDGDEHYGNKVTKSSQIPRNKLKRFFKKLWEGPSEPVDKYSGRIESFAEIESLPKKLRYRTRYSVRVSILLIYVLSWFLINSAILIPYLTLPSSLSEDTNIDVVPLSCTSQVPLWRGKNGACGMEGELCEVDTQRDVIFKCPALCDRGSWTFSWIPIGDKSIKYQSYVVGGGNDIKEAVDTDQLTKPFRLDSYVCGAAVHAGIISPFFGGCVRTSFLNDSQGYFESLPGHYGMTPSIPFLSFFKTSFIFKKLNSGLNETTEINNCYDPRVPVVAINIILGIPIVYLCKSVVIFWIISIVGFWTVCLAADPPSVVDANDITTLSNLLSLSLQQFFPSCFILHFLWHYSVKRTISCPSEGEEVKGSTDSPLSRVLIWYPCFSLGVLNNVTFDRILVDRLTVADIKQQAGAVLVVFVLLTSLLVCGALQGYKLWLSGRFKKYLLFYLMLIAVLTCIALLPGLTLRIHHYILAILLLPGCNTRGRTTMIFLGILLGLFISGSSRWGLASIAETASVLRRDDPTGIVKPPEFLGYDKTSGILSWSYGDLKKSLDKGFDGVSLLINDIEWFVDGIVDSVNLSTLINEHPSLKEQIQMAMETGYRLENGDILLYLRVGKVMLESKTHGDYSGPAILKWPSAEFINIGGGPT